MQIQLSNIQRGAFLERVVVFSHRLLGNMFASRSCAAIKSLDVCAFARSNSRSERTNEREDYNINRKINIKTWILEILFLAPPSLSRPYLEFQIAYYQEPCFTTNPFYITHLEALIELPHISTAWPAYIRFKACFKNKIIVNNSIQLSANQTWQRRQLQLPQAGF